MILVFWMLSFKPTFSLSFTFIERLFSSSSLSSIRVVSSAYLRLLIFLPAVLTPACASFCLAFHVMYSAYKLNKQGHKIQPWCTPFLIWNQSAVTCPVLTVASWPAYRFLRKQVRWSGIPISKNIPQFVVIHTVRSSSWSPSVYEMSEWFQWMASWELLFSFKLDLVFLGMPLSLCATLIFSFIKQRFICLIITHIHTYTYAHTHLYIVCVYSLLNHVGLHFFFTNKCARESSYERKKNPCKPLSNLFSRLPLP